MDLTSPRYVVIPNNLLKYQNLPYDEFGFIIKFYSIFNAEDVPLSAVYQSFNESKEEVLQLIKKLVAKDIFVVNDAYITSIRFKMSHELIPLREDLMNDYGIIYSTKTYFQLVYQYLLCDLAPINPNDTTIHEYPLDFHYFEDYYTFYGISKEAFIKELKYFERFKVIRLTTKMNRYFISKGSRFYDFLEPYGVK